jgi:hypothetical protein
MKKTRVSAVCLFVIVIILAGWIYYKHTSPKENDSKSSTKFLDDARGVTSSELENLIAKRTSAGSGSYDFRGTAGGEDIIGTITWKDYNHYKINVKQTGRKDMSYIVAQGLAYRSQEEDKWFFQGAIMGEIGSAYFDNGFRVYVVDNFLLEAKENISNTKFLKDDSLNGEDVKVYGCSYGAQKDSIQYQVELYINESGLVKRVKVVKTVSPQDIGSHTEAGFQTVYEIEITKVDLHIVDDNEFFIPKDMLTVPEALQDEYPG